MICSAAMRPARNCATLSVLSLMSTSMSGSSGLFRCRDILLGYRKLRFIYKFSREQYCTCEIRHETLFPAFQFYCPELRHLSLASFDDFKRSRLLVPIPYLFGRGRTTRSMYKGDFLQKIKISSSLTSHATVLPSSFLSSLPLFPRSCALLLLLLQPLPYPLLLPA